MLNKLSDGIMKTKLLISTALLLTNLPGYAADDRERTNTSARPTAIVVKPYDLSDHTSWGWRLKRNIYLKLFATERAGVVAEDHKPIPAAEDEDMSIVPFTELGYPLPNVYTTESPPNNEKSLVTKFGAKFVAFALNYFPLTGEDVAEAPMDSDQLINLIFPTEYQKLLPCPTLPIEISHDVHDIVGGTALSGPFARYVKRAQDSDMTGMRSTSLHAPFHSPLYAIELDGYNDLEPKEGIEFLGGRAILAYDSVSQYMKTQAIHYRGGWYYPGDQKWDHVQKILLATMTTDTAVIRHLLNTHLIVAGTFAAVTNKTLRANHPIRTFLHSHQFGTLSTNNYKVPILLSGEGSMFPSLMSYNLETVARLMNRKADAFSIADLVPYEDLAQRGMTPEDNDGVVYPYADSVKQLWDLTQQYVSGHVDSIYPTDAALMADPQMTAWYDALKQYVPNRQVEAYTPGGLSKHNIARLIALQVYTDSVEHYNVGTMTYHFQSWVNYIPTNVRKDGRGPSLGEAQMVANLLFATQPSYGIEMTDRSVDHIDATRGKMSATEFHGALLRIQANLESRFATIPASVIQPSHMQAAVNS